MVASAAPVTMGTPNLLSRMPVVVFSWVCVDAGRDADEDALGPAGGASGGLDEGDLGEVVDDDAADAGLDGERELLGAFVVAVEVDGVHADAGSAEDGDLAA